MRIVAQVPHPLMKISIFSWNDKYFIEMEAGAYKQTFKIGHDGVKGLDDVKALCTPDFLEAAMLRFENMHTDFSQAYKTITTT